MATVFLMVKLAGDCAEAVLRQTVLQFIRMCWSSSQANSPSHLWNCLGNCVLLLGQLCLTTWQLCLTTWQLCLTTWQLCLTTWATVSYYLATVSYYLGNCVLLLGQLCLTTWATVSYCLWKWLANSPPIYRTVLGTVLKQFSGKQSSPFMELFGQLCLTTWATVSYYWAIVSYCLATVSYYLCNCVLLLVEMVSKEFSYLWKRF